MSLIPAAAILGLRLRSFRSYDTLDLTCAPQTVILTGANGAGKTNILEAISLLSETRGIRKAKMDEILRHAPDADDVADNWAIGADIAAAHAPLKVQMNYTRASASRVSKVDGKTSGALAKCNAYLPQLWLTPRMDRLFSDAASARRRFFDHFVRSLDAAHQKHLSRYEKAMRERNRLLAEESLEAQWLDALESEMAATGLSIAAARLQALDKLASWLADMPDSAFPRAQLALAGDIEADLRIRDAADIEADFRADLGINRGRDARARRALQGVHCSDLIVTHLRTQLAAQTCSTGEQKALLVGLILAQAQCLMAQRAIVPLLLLDEVCAHLDARARAALAEALEHIGAQAWITGTEAHYFSDFGDKGTHFCVENGKING